MRSIHISEPVSALQVPMTNDGSAKKKKKKKKKFDLTITGSYHH